MANDRSMDNVKFKKQGRTLFLKIDLDEDFGATNSGRTHKVAGCFWAKLDEILNDKEMEGYKLNLMLVKPIPKETDRAESFDEEPSFEDDQPAKVPQKPAGKKVTAKKPAAKKPGTAQAKTPAKKPTRKIED